MEQLKGDDALFIAMERSTAPVHIASLVIYDPSTAPGGFVRFKDILSFIESRLHLSKTMRRKMVKVPFNIDYPYWVEDDDFDLEYHVRHLSLPEPGDWRQLCIQTARIFARPLDMTRPPWEMTVIGGLDKIGNYPKGCYGILTKIHHSAIDGVSGVDLMQALHTLTPDVTPPKNSEVWEPESRPSDTKLFLTGYKNILLRPIRTVNALRKATPGIAKVALAGRPKKRLEDRRTPTTRFNLTISPHRVFDARHFDLAQVKAMRQFSEGCKVNDVMLSIVSGALRHYLEGHDELPSNSLKTIIPINIRTEEQKGTMGNQVSAMMTSLGTDIADPVERLRFIHEQTLAAKIQTSDLGPREITGVMQQLPLNAMRFTANLHHSLGLANRTKKTINTIVTNVPGPPIPLYSSGAKAVAMFGQICLVDGVGLGHVVTSYVDKIAISFTGCRDAIPDPLVYAKCIEKSFAEHALALVELEYAKTNEKPAAKAKKPAARKPKKPSKPSKPKAAKPKKPASASKK
ncbi:MAG: wax ester/triacylglycerol synthase family O-acyltransferase [Hellea sp.]|nr:wax ester/triacylglycerol synthase family O-acyltransferase [Hellea sp.]